MSDAVTDIMLGDMEKMRKRIAELEAALKASMAALEDQVTEIPTLCRKYEGHIAELETENARLQSKVCPWCWRSKE